MNVENWKKASVLDNGELIPNVHERMINLLDSNTNPDVLISYCIHKGLNEEESVTLINDIYADIKNDEVRGV